jgi:hypothetical protein
MSDRSPDWLKSKNPACAAVKEEEDWAGRSENPCVYRELRPYDCVNESPNVSGDDRSVLPPPHPVRLAVQVEEPT